MSIDLTSRLKEHTPTSEFQADWTRQRRTAADILRRLDGQEGVIVADQVGMGKTFVALAVAASQILATDELGQVLVLAPAAVAEKWIQEWAKFSESLLSPDGPQIRCVPTALRSGEALLAALDDPPERQSHLIVATHTALTSRLKDSFVQLAVLHVAVRGRPGAGEYRARVARWCDKQSGLIQDRRFTPDRVNRLLASPPGGWRLMWQQLTGDELDDDPVPSAILEALLEVDLTAVRACVDSLPKYTSKNIAVRLKAARTSLADATQATWRSALAATRLQLPLLVVDEAHRLKNDQTRISQLFAPRRPDADAGALTGHFERMLLLTATPFELGHSELIRVLSRLSAVRSSPPPNVDPLDVRLTQLSEVLRRAQLSAVKLDECWSGVDAQELAEFDGWTPRKSPPEKLGAAATAAWRAAQAAARTRREMHDALQPWVIRHQRKHRRTYVQGDLVALDGIQSGRGIAIGDEIALPFLLAARAQALAGDETQGAGRPHFAYGIASSFEAFRRLGGQDLDTDHEEDASSARGTARVEAGSASWYRQEIDDLLVRGGLDLTHHPKISTTVERATDLWLRGDKCLVFCWFIRTGQAVEKALQTRIDAVVQERAGGALGLSRPSEIADELERLGERLLKRGSSSYDVVRSKLEKLFGSVLSAPTAADLTESLAEVVIRHLRSPGYLVRFAPLSPTMNVDDLWRGVCGENTGGIDLRVRWTRFAHRVAVMGADERFRVFEALLGEQADRPRPTDDEESQGRGASLRTVRRAHGGTEREIRQRLITVFNTPFAPDLLVASSVMGEGIDLHRECRHVIHHDLDWNPSVLEQRTGRLDRIGALAEIEKADIAVYEPYLAGTHDEKMFRVVKDRAGWFDVVMGRPSAADERTTDAEEVRQPLAPSIARTLKMDLGSP